VVNTLSDCATAKATNAATRGRLVTASYCDFTIFVALAAVTARAMSAAAAPVATISLATVVATALKSELFPNPKTHFSLETCRR